MAGFYRFPLEPELQRAIAESGYDEPRPIQSQGIPPAMAGRDLLALAQTGTGKTAAFCLPLLNRLLLARRSGPRALVVAPTRELATQVHAELTRFAAHTPLRVMSVFGGVPISRQIRALKQPADVLVACPGRLLDLLGRAAVRLDRIEVLVLDEADHMFDMGFLPDLRHILRALPARRQNLLFSATMPKEIRKLADAMLVDPVVIDLAGSQPLTTIAHAMHSLGESEKMTALLRLLHRGEARPAIVFLRTKRRVQRVARALDAKGHAAVALQGNMSQSARDRALGGFREGRFDVLVATDVAARGLDIARISHVVNYDMPSSPEAYTYRTGRTGRSEQAGTAVTFVTPGDEEAARVIAGHLGIRKGAGRPKEDRGPDVRNRGAEVGSFPRNPNRRRTRRGAGPNGHMARAASNRLRHA